MLTVIIMNNIVNKAKNGAMKVGKFRDFCFYTVYEDGSKELSAGKALCWAVVMDILAHLMPIVMLFVLVLLVAIDFGGGRLRKDSQTPETNSGDTVIDGEAIPV
jgi:hypothetical protein